MITQEDLDRFDEELKKLMKLCSMVDDFAELKYQARLVMKLYLTLNTRNGKG